MSRIYDNWERLVAAVLKREQIRQLCYAPSSSSGSTLSSDFSTISTSQPDESSQIENELTEPYKPGVHVTLEASGDESIKVKRVRFSPRKFNEKEAETWWLNNRDKVYKKYNDLAALAQLKKLSISGKAGSASIVTFLDIREESNEQPLSQTTFDQNMKSRNSEVEGTASHIADVWIETYEPGVHVTLSAFRDGSRDIKRIRFSRRRFREHEAEAWWLENREKVYKKYSVIHP
ncbi:protein Brevis radix-like 2 [Sesamum indicum]|uniref:Protein Brevis radix-like 2 n=1 Tax=Sesamum indicum TaxID=4182 RepID=A0A6I9T7J9_SESIN|nr:protein Brevis radix-like 2 [Sesamum indicum]